MMISHYLLSAARQLRRHPGTYAVGIAGLALGIASALLLFLYIQYELQYDSSHQNAPRIAQLLIQGFSNDKSDIHDDSFNVEVGSAIAQGTAGVERFTRVAPMPGAFESQAGLISDDEPIFADPAFFSIFSHESIAGDPGSALMQPDSIVLTHSLAKKLFGQENPMNRTVKFHSAKLSKAFMATVRAVISDPSPQTTLQFSCVFPVERYITDYPVFQHQRGHSLYAGPFANTYFLLHSAENFSQVQTAVKSSRVEDTGSNTIFDRYSYDIQRLPDIHLQGKNGLSSGQPKHAMVRLSLLAFLCVLVFSLSIVNTVNLFLVQFSARSREIGIRSVNAACPRNIRTQFLVESAFFGFCALAAALIFIELGLPFLNQALGVRLQLDFLHNPALLAAILLTPLATGLLAGLYPALYIASLPPRQALTQDRLPVHKKIRWLFVGIQFAVSIICLVLTLFFSAEVKTLLDTPFGFDNQNVVVMKIRDQEVLDRYQEFRAALETYPVIDSVGMSSTANWKGSFIPYSLTVQAPLFQNVSCTLVLADSGYLKAYRIPLVEGETSPDNAFGTSAVVNEQALQAFSWDKTGGKLINLRAYHARVTGTVSDFFAQSPLMPKRPLILINRQNWFDIEWQYLSVRFTSLDDNARNVLQTVWRQFFPDIPLDYQVAHTITADVLHQSLAPIQFALTFALVIASVITMIGLFSLAVFETKRRTKEIGIRKALGATSMSISALFLLDYGKLLAWATAFAWPASFLLIKLSLSVIHYPFPVWIRFDVFLMAGIISMLLTVLAVGLITWNAARTNPVKTLRYE